MATRHQTYVSQVGTTFVNLDPLKVNASAAQRSLEPVVTRADRNQQQLDVRVHFVHVAAQELRKKKQ